jgi:hypothetical protein
MAAMRAFQPNWHAIPSDRLSGVKFLGVDVKPGNVRSTDALHKVCVVVAGQRNSYAVGSHLVLQELHVLPSPAGIVIEFVLDLAGYDGPRTIRELMAGDDGVDVAQPL